MPTAPVTASVSGASFTVTVTPANLDPSLTIRDFTVLENGSPTANPLSYTKVTPTSIQYSGPSLPTTTLEVRRNTPRGQIITAVPNTKVRAIDWNREFDRRVRIQEEVDLFGAGGGFSVRLPLDDPYGSAWSTDTLFSPTRRVLWDKFESTAPLASPAFTGNPTVPTQLTSDNSTRVASTAYVKSNLTGLAPIASPAFTGSPTVPTATTADNSTLIASTAHVKANLASYAPLASPAFTGTPTVPTMADGVKTTQSANALNLQRRSRPVVILNRGSSLSLTGPQDNDITFTTAVTDTSGAYNTSTGIFTPPYTGVYYISALILVNATDITALTLTTTSNTEVARVAQAYRGSVGAVTMTGGFPAILTGGTQYKFRIYANQSTSTSTGSQCQVAIHYLGIETAS